VITPLQSSREVGTLAGESFTAIARRPKACKLARPRLAA
jgi:hypothetical protein